MRGLKVETAPDGKRTLTWEASPEPDFCYYRVYRGAGRPPLDVAHQIASTIATHYTDAAPPAGASYRVVAVDQSGNAGP